MNSFIKKEYFELLKKLNRTNKQKNLNTDIYFYIDDSDSNFLILFAAISKDQKIILADKMFKKNWIPKYLSGFSDFEEFIVEILNTEKLNDNLTDQLKSHIFKLE